MGGGLTATTMTKKKKKKGRPSLLDIQKRSLKQQQQQQLHQRTQQQNPNSFKPNLRSTRQNPNFNYNDDDDDERKQKKHKLLLGLDNSSNNHHYHRRQQQQQQFSISSPDFSAPNSILNSNRRNIGHVRTGSDQTEEKVLKATDTLYGSPVDSGPTTPLPDKKLLVFVLDRLQKKDTYGVFSEPVDPEELPDYHEIIAHPMDFATVRKKLDGGAYANLEQFEKDVFLLCSNAMQYNAPDTIYFRQARTIQELAKKDFENLRQDSDDSEPQSQPKVVRRGRPPKSLKKSFDTSSDDHAAFEFSSDATLANGGDNGNWAGSHNLRKGPMTSFKFRPAADALNRASHGSHSRTGETYCSWLSEWENEFPASVVKAVLRYGKKQFTLDENRRDTYKEAMSSGHEPSVFTTFEGELKQLMVVGLNTEHSYARSLARFAADLGPVVWKIASKKIESVLPIGVKLSPGWIGDNKAIEQQQHLYTEKQKSSNNFMSVERPSRLLSPTTSGSNSAIGNRYSLQIGEDMETIREVNSQSESMFLNNTLGGLKSVPPFQSYSRSVSHSDMNGFSGGFGLNRPPQVGTVGLATEPGKSRFDDCPVPSEMLGTAPNSSHPICSISTNDHDSNQSNLADCSSSLHSENSLFPSPGARLHTAVNVGLQGELSWRPLSAINKQVFHPLPPDLNVSFLAPGSPISNIQISSQQQPDLALQL